MRLHIVPDEKVINRCIDAFNSVFPDENVFIVFLNDEKSLPQYVQKKNQVFYVKFGSSIFWNIIGDVNKYAAIIIHFFTTDSIRFVNSINHSKIYWIEWGADLYSGLLENRGYQLYADRKILWRISTKKIPYRLYQLLYKMKLCKKTHELLHAVKKVHYFVPDSMYDEYPLLLSYYPELSHLEYKDFFYYPIDEILSDELYCSITKGNNIIIGNSSSPTGNHLSIFERLKMLGVNDKKIFVPLSYGNMNYANYISKVGEQYFGRKFNAIRDFMSLEEYNKFLLSADVFIYGNWRQEAVGNILIALFIGGKVFLDEKNPLLKFYKDKGLVIFGLNELTVGSIINQLSSNEIANNRKILNNIYSKERLYYLIKSNF